LNLVTLPQTRLNCVLRASEAAHLDAVTSWLRVSARVGEISTCRTDTDLRTLLQDRSPANLPNFVVLIAGSSELPPYLLRYPDLRVLVLTTQRKIGSLTPWLQQGATDVASLARPQQVQYALGRMIDDAAMEKRVDLLASELNRSEERYLSLIEQGRPALSLWRDDELMAASASFSQITGLKVGATSDQWFAGFDADSKAAIGDQIAKVPNNARVVLEQSQQTVRITHEPRCDAHDDNEHLVSVKWVLDAVEPTEPLANDTLVVPPPTLTTTANLPTPETDSVSGLPARQTVVNKFQRWLQAANDNSRYVAMTVDLSDSTLNDDTKSHTDDAEPLSKVNAVSSTNTASAVDRTLQDLAVYRAADRLTRTLSANTLLGRLNDDRLLIIRELEADEAPRMLAKGIRRSLGSLGGLLETPEAVRINTVNVSAKAGTTAEGLVTRLENR